jgi:hypothetical protein
MILKDGNDLFLGVAIGVLAESNISGHRFNGLDTDLNGFFIKNLLISFLSVSNPLNLCPKI